MARGDGLLSHDLLPGEKGPQDACGVFGVWAPGDEVAKLTYFGLYALQHRGQESAGIAVSDGAHIVVYKDMGLVSQVFTEASLESLRGHVAIGHTRYSTSGASVWENAQPTFRATATGHLALGHNGNLTNTHDLRVRLATRSEESGELPFGGGGHGTTLATSDTDTVTALIASHPDLTIEAAALAELPHLRGAFSLVFMDDDALYGASGAGSSPARRPPSTSSAPRSSARSSPGSSSSSTPRACARTASRRPTPRAACSSSSTWLDRTRPSADAACRPSGSCLLYTSPSPRD